MWFIKLSSSWLVEAPGKHMEGINFNADDVCEWLCEWILRETTVSDAFEAGIEAEII